MAQYVFWIEWNVKRVRPVQTAICLESNKEHCVDLVAVSNTILDKVYLPRFIINDDVWDKKAKREVWFSAYQVNINFLRNR